MSGRVRGRDEGGEAAFLLPISRQRDTSNSNDKNVSKKSGLIVR
jgi:hypothetical protein